MSLNTSINGNNSTNHKQGIFLNKSMSSFPVPTTPSRRLSVYGGPGSTLLKTPSTTRRRETLGSSLNLRPPLGNVTNMSISGGNILTTPSKSNSNRRVSSLPSNLPFSSIPMVVHPSINLTAVTKRDDEQSLKIEEMDMELQRLKNEKSELILQAGQQREAESALKNKYESIIHDLEQELKIEKQNYERSIESVQSSGRRMEHLTRLNNLYASKLEAIGFNPIELNEIQLSESDSQRHEQMKIQFDTEAVQVRSRLDSHKHDNEQELELLEKTRAQLEQLMIDLDPDVLGRDLGMHEEHIEHLKKRFDNLIQPCTEQEEDVTNKEESNLHTSPNPSRKRGRCERTPDTIEKNNNLGRKSTRLSLSQDFQLKALPDRPLFTMGENDI